MRAADKPLYAVFQVIEAHGVVTRIAAGRLQPHPGGENIPDHQQTQSIKADQRYLLSAAGGARAPGTRIAITSLTSAVLAAHLKGEVHIGLYPLLNGDKCRWLAADFDGPEAIVDALMYVKASRKLEVPVAVEVSRSGVGAHTWVFFTSPVPAELTRRLAPD